MASVAAAAAVQPTYSQTTAWDLLLVSVAIYIAASVGRIHDLFPILAPLKPALLATCAAVSLLLLQQNGRRRIALLRSRITTCLIGLVVWGALAVPFALTGGVAMHFWIDFARAVVMCLVLAASVRTAGDLERLGLVYFGVTVVYTAVILSRFQLGSADNWRLGRLYFYDANDLATLIVTALPLGLYFALAHRRVVLRLAALVGLLLLVVALIRSGSRGGFLAFLAVAAFILVGFTTISARARIGGLLVILTVLGATASDRYWTQMQTIIRPHEDYNLTDETGRVQIWERGIGYTLDNPIFGVGPGNFPAAEGRLSPFANRAQFGYGVRWNAPHNSYLQIAAETGIPGFVLFLMMVGSALAALRRLGRKNGDAPDAEHRVMAQTLNASFVGFLVGAFFLSLAYSEILYTLLAMTVALQKIAQQRRDELAA
jgi:probable O-glycosylation ligase (exosortase A-associated)